MAFLEKAVRPECAPANTVHHSSAAGRFLPDLEPQPFPATAYRGFVGQPVNCPHRCAWASFLVTGCEHVAASQVMDPALAARLRHQPDVLAGVAAFVGS